LLDRAVDDLRFEPIRRFAKENHLRRINPLELSHWAEDKATMHLELIQAGVETPYTILIAPFIDQPILPWLDLTPLGEKFVLKPAVGGGGEGVMMNASTLDDVRCARLEFPDQKYLAQAHIEPRLLSGRKAWFRIFYVGGDCIPCWWNPSTHIYKVLTSEEETQFELAPLRQVTERIARVCKLDWFSTEIAFTNDDKFVAVDYVNDSIDTRIQSKAVDGVPDDVMKRITNRLIELSTLQI
jgi:glutathione synthase/RimK-type ligase-like ATP-grasp enzyme